MLEDAGADDPAVVARARVALPGLRESRVRPADGPLPELPVLRAAVARASTARRTATGARSGRSARSSAARAIRDGRASRATSSTPRCPRSRAFTSPRAWAYALLGIDEYLRAFQGDSDRARTLRAELAERLLGLFRRTSRPDWPWFEDRRDVLQRAAVAGADRVRDADGTGAEMTDGRDAIARLARVRCSRHRTGTSPPIGSNGFYARGAMPRGLRSAAGRGVRDDRRRASRRSGRAATRAGRSTRGARSTGSSDRTTCSSRSTTPSTGGCRDGLHADRVNENQGAEVDAVVPARAVRDARGRSRGRHERRLSPRHN